MTTVLVTLKTDPAERPALAREVTRLAERARALPGNAGFSVLTDADDPTALVIAQDWQSNSEFEAYKAGPVFADLGALLRPALTAPPMTRQFGTEVMA